MDNYIKQVLLEENTIILPKLGALTVTSIKTGEMMFLSYLNYDDGKLAKFVAEKENITEDEARAKVKAFVDEIKQKIEDGSFYNLGKLGHFFKKNDEVFFEDYSTYEDQEEETEDQIKIIEVEVPDKVTPISVETKEETAHNVKVFKLASPIDDREWSELWNIFKGQSILDFKKHLKTIPKEEQKTRDVWNEWYNGSDMRGWWD